ncbi:protein translocase subunit SecF [Microterricola viridarii]|uniref:Protein-export membrane protein SecF n=1 Tax=Microterricola viridarii TaxID=412690 RepID=A0A0X8E2B4_9MICO|nr:protein translocase subunit SecF [Microterricola viridarii]AMB58334.1 preprotein translocase subunit SecF [Microterricola viridarii]
MANRMATFGNDLYTGKRSFNFVGNRNRWYIIVGVLVLAAIVIPIVKGGFNFGIEFTGGSQFVVTSVENATQEPGTAAVASVVPDAVAYVTTVGSTGVRVQTDQLTQEQTHEVAAALAVAYNVPETEVASSFIGPVWGADITRQTVQGLIILLVLAAIGMALYFRTWKMSLAAIGALLVDLIVTVGIYAATGFEMTPAAVIGILTIMAYSLYDTVVVFDKIRENTTEDAVKSKHTFAESTNLAVNQTLVRSINTSVVAALPVAAILFFGAFVLGADTLRDISLALFIGILVGTWSTVFLAAPLYSQLREGEKEIVKHDKQVLAAREKAAAATADAATA